MRLPSVLALCVALGGCASIDASVGGFVAADGRVFFEPPKYSGQDPGNAVSLVTEPQLALKGVEGTHAIALRPFYRLDPADERRSHLDVREALYRLTTEHFELTAGVGLLSWGVLESHRPTDVVNQIDLVESLTGSAKLGQPMVSLGWIGESLSFRIYALPWFRERTFPGVRGRLRFPLLVDVDSAQYESKLKQWQPSGAARVTFSHEGFDLSASVFTGTSREPRFIVELTGGQVVPRYDVMHQASLEAEMTLGPLVLKAEGFFRLWTNELKPFGGGGVGLDYTVYQFVGEADFTLAVEGLFDSRPRSAPITFYDHDAFVAFRIALNDTASTEFTGGALVDVLDATSFLRVEASRRFGEHWRLTVGGNVYLGSSYQLAASFLRDHHAYARVAYFF